MATKREGVVIKAVPLTIQSDRKKYSAASQPGLAVGAVVRFEPNGAVADKVKVIVGKPGHGVGRHSGIVVGKGQLCDTSSMEGFLRETDNWAAEDLKVGDRVNFTVMSDDRLAWDIERRKSRG